MSQETREWLSENILVGFTDQRGEAWHYRQGDQNHYPGAVPLQKVRELFDWEVTKEPVVVAGKTRESVAWYAPKFDTVFGYFSPGATVHPYGKWLVDGVETLLAGELKVGGSGLLRNRAVAYVQAEIPENVVDAETGEVFRATILASTSLDGTLATSYQIVFTRVVCDNTLFNAMGSAIRSIRIRHTRNSEARFAQAQEALGLLETESQKIIETTQTLSGIKITPAEWAKFLDAYVPIPDEKGRGKTMAENKRDALTGLWNGDDRVAPWSGTAWGVAQAVNTYNHHLAIVRKSAARFERNTLNVITGKSEALDTAALKTLAKVVDNSVLVAVA